MRDPGRIDRVLAALGALWRDHPEQRLGQMILNLTRNERGETDKQVCWNTDDDELLREITDAARHW